RPFVHDASDENGASRLVAEVEQAVGPIEILVANSGGRPAGAGSPPFTLDQWRAAYDMLLLGQIALVEAALPGMRERGWGRVLSLSSSVVAEAGRMPVL